MASIAGSRAAFHNIACAIVLGALVVHGVNAQPVSSSACPSSDTIRLNYDGPWRCAISLEENQPYLLRVSQGRANLAVDWIDPEGQPLITVDSPARRYGPELLLAVPNRSGNYSFVIRFVQLGPLRIDADFSLAPLEDSGEIVDGLERLTRASSTVLDKNAPLSVDARVRNLDMATALFAAAGRRELEAESRMRTAALEYWISNDWTRAAASAKAAAETFASLDDEIGQGHADTLRAAAIIEMSDASSSVARRRAAPGQPSPFDEAKRLLTSAVATFRRNAMTSAEAEARNFLGVAYFYESRPRDAREQWVHAAKLYEEVSESAVLPLQNIAVLDYGAGDYDRAIATYERVLVLLDEQTDVSTRIAVLNNLSVAERVSGRVDKALDLQLRALGLGGSAADRAQTLHNLGVIYLSLGDGQRASTFLEQALHLRRLPETGDQRGLLTSLIRVGELYRDHDEYERALELHLDALTRADSLTERGRSLLAVAEDHIAAGDIDVARQAAEAAQRLDLPSQWPLSRSIASTLAYARLLAGDANGASALLAAARSNEDAGDAELAARDFHRLSLQSYRSGALDMALDHVQRAIGIYETQRIFAINPDLRATYLAQRAETYYLRTEALMTKAAQSGDETDRQRWLEQALSAADAGRARTLMEFESIGTSGEDGSHPESRTLSQLDRQIAAKRHRLAAIQDQRNPSIERIAELQREIQVLRARADLAASHATSIASSSTELSIDAIREGLSPDSLVLTYLSGFEHTWLVVLTREVTEAVLLGSRARIDSVARRLASGWSRYSPTQDADFELEASDRLLGPAAEMLEGRSHVILIVDGGLRRLPFAALRLRDSGRRGTRRLAETHIVSYRTMLSGLAWKDAQVESASGENRMLLVGAPLFDQAQKDHGSSELTAIEFAPLPGAAREIDMIAGTAATWDVDKLTGERATKANLMRQPIRSYRIVHFATHAQLDVQDPQLSAIALTSVVDGTPVADPMLSLREVIDLDLGADVVVLSACESSLGKDYRAQTSFGLSEAFLLAGARHVLGSLWPVPDHATSEYMHVLYSEYIGRGRDLDEATFEAVRAMMRTPRYRHPYYWAAFVVLAR